MSNILIASDSSQQGASQATQELVGAAAVAEAPQERRGPAPNTSKKRKGRRRK